MNSSSLILYSLFKPWSFNFQTVKGIDLAGEH